MAAALEPAEPGGLVRRTRFLPGIAATGDQIVTYGTHWRDLASDALAANKPTVVALGDSLAQGIGASSPMHGYVGRILDRLEVEGVRPPVLNLSRSGATMSDVVDIQLPALAEAGVNSRWVVCTVGSNDLLRSARFWRLRAQARRLIEALPTNTIVATAPARGSLVAKYLNRCLADEARQQQMLIADVNAHLTTWRGHLAADRFHPNDTGYRLWAAAFAPHLHGIPTDGLARRSGWISPR